MSYHFCIFVLLILIALVPLQANGQVHNIKNEILLTHKKKQKDLLKQKSNKIVERKFARIEYSRLLTKWKKQEKRSN